MTFFGLPLGTVIALVVMIVLPFIAHGLYRLDQQEGDGYITYVGYRGDPSA